MIVYNIDNEIKELNFTDLYNIERWTKKMMYEIKAIEGQLCPCKYKILSAKWHEIIYWYSLFCNNAIADGLVSIENFVSAILNVVKRYEAVLEKDKIHSEKIYDIFRELHKVTTTEFIDASKSQIKKYNNKEIKSADFINNIGEYLYKVLINSIFELHEINIKCNDCEFSNVNNNESIRFLINDLYNINSYALFKLEKFIDILDVDTKTIDFIADFKYFDVKSLNPNIIEMLSLAKSKFKSLTITNTNQTLLKSLESKFQGNIVI